MKAILAADKNWSIGKDGKLLTHLPGDLKYFKENTLGKTIVMGRKTLESLPGGKPLPDRTNVVLTRNKGLSIRGAHVCHDPDEIIEMEKAGAPIIIAGGGEIYRQFLPYCDEVLVTRIDEDFHGDTYFENLDEREDFVCACIGDVIKENGTEYRFTRYERKTKKQRD